MLLRAIDTVTAWTGRLLARLAVPMVLFVFANVVLRYVFGLGYVWMYEIVGYCFAILLTGLAGWALQTDEHVRVDVVYAALGERWRGLIDLLGALLLLAPFPWIMWDRGLPYVARSWRFREGSVELSGLPFVWLLKTFMLVFVVVLAVAGVAFAIRAALRLMGRTT